jgi:hypothetical protein
MNYYFIIQPMEYLKTVNYKQLENLRELTKVEKLYCLPINWLWLSQKQVDKIDTTDFIYPWKRNRDRYFTKKIECKWLEELKNVYFSKERLEELLFEYVDYIEETETFIYVKVWEENWYLVNPKEYFKPYLEANLVLN